MVAARRRLTEELGVDAALSFAFFSRYQADLDHGMHENEFVYVYFGRLRAELRPDPAEVADVTFLPPEDIERRIQKKPNAFAYWLRHYFHDHAKEIARHANKAARAA
jgi:isopentenyl-diphosphate delta-isomerase